MVCTAGLQPLPVVPEVPEPDDVEPALVPVPDVEALLVPVAPLVRVPGVPVVVVVAVPLLVPEDVPVPVEEAELVEPVLAEVAVVPAVEIDETLDVLVELLAVELVAPKLVASPVVPELLAAAVGRPVPMLVALTPLVASVDESVEVLPADEAETDAVPELDPRLDELAPVVVDRPVLVEMSVPSSVPVVSE